MRTDERHCFQKIGDWCKACVATTFVIEFSPTQELELRPVERIAVDLSMIQLDGTDGLFGREDVSTSLAQPQVAHQVVMLRKPARDSRCCDLAAAFWVNRQVAVRRFQ